MKLRKVLVGLAGLAVLGIAGTYAIGSNPLIFGAAVMN